MEVDASAVRENQGIVRRHTGGTGSPGKTVLRSKKKGKSGSLCNHEAQESVQNQQNPASKASKIRSIS